MVQNNHYENVELYNVGVNMVNSYNSPARYPMHWHKIAEVAYLPPTADGGLPHKVKVYSEVYDLEPGDVLFIWPGQVHEIKENPDKALVGLQFSMSEIMEFLDFLPYLTSYREINLLRCSEHPALLEAIQKKLSEIVEYHHTRPRFFGVEMMKRIYDICILLAHYIDESGCFYAASQPHSMDTLEKINASCEYIRNHLDEDLSLGFVAEQIGFSVAYFSRTFKAVMGISYLDYVNYQRVRLAESMLSENLLPITAVCFKAGFSSTATFNRIFKKVTGTSPREFKQYHYMEG